MTAPLRLPTIARNTLRCSLACVNSSWLNPNRRSSAVDSLSRPAATVCVRDAQPVEPRQIVRTAFDVTRLRPELARRIGAANKAVGLQSENYASRVGEEQL